ncbi:MAG TPA: lipid II flippase MurJ, partial [Methylophilaceae bacterium]|nr:lipid II flippase MurJ [Methylophilaceae bacterium]
MTPTIARQASFIGLTALGGAVVGFFLQLLLAYYFGAGKSTDAFFMAASLSELLTKLLMGGSITAVFLPMFVHYLAQDQRAQAWDLALNILHIATSLFAVLLIGVGMLAQPIVSIIAPGFDAATQALTVQLLYVLLPSFLALFLVDLLTTILHAIQRFTIPALL